METKKIDVEVKEKGFVHLRWPDSIQITELEEHFGKILFKTAVKENPKSTRLVSSNESIDLHTDHISARYIGWQCINQAAIGGETILVDALSVINCATEELKSLLKNLQVSNHRIFQDDKPNYPLYSNTEREIIYYASFLCQQPNGTREQQALEWFEKNIRTAQCVEFKLSEGDWLIVDNNRMLHGRRAFNSGAGRVLQRYWFSGIEK